MGVSNQPGVQHPQTPAGVNDPTSIDFVGDPTTDPGHKHTAASAPGTAPPLPASTVIGPDVFGASPAVGTDDTFAREDHDHGLPNTAMTQSIGDNSTLIATDAFVQTAVNNAIAGVNPAVAVLVATTASGDTSALIYSNGAGGVGATLTGSVNTPITIDGVLLNTLGQRLLVKNDTQSPSGAFNGIYYLTIVSSSGTAPVFTRAADYNTPTEINNTGAIPVQSGTANADTSWLLTSQVATVGTSPLTYVQFTLNPTTIMTKSTYDPAAIAQQVVGTTATQTLTNKTLTAPVISSIVNTGTLTLPTASDTLTGRATTDTLTNKRVTYRVYAYSGPGATPTIDTDTYDVVNMTALAANVTSMTTNLTGTPNSFDRLILGFTDNGTARTIAWGTSFEASTVALPTTTVISTLLLVGFLWNPTTSKWRCVATA